jgi:regulator of sirC expression with transglutaminase-like and TPR domain
MLNNLRNVYISAGDWAKAIAVVERLRMTQPGDPDCLRDLGLLHYHNGSLRRSVQCLSAYLQTEPDAQDAIQVKQSLGFIAHQLAQLN